MNINQYRPLRHGFAQALLLIALCLAGCGPSHPRTYPVQGHVRFADGTPVTWGTIECESADQKLMARGMIARDGSFRLTTFSKDDGLIAGRHRAIVTQLVVVDRFPPIQHAHGSTIHSRYSSYATANLTLDINPETANSIELVVAKARQGQSNSP